METGLSRVTSKGQIVIPKKLREKYAIAPSMRIRWISKEEGLLLVPEAEDAIKAARGMLPGSGLLKAYMKEKALEKQKEAKRRGKRG
jgi:AbrB family looped-hinge helix DNA binding protein